MGPTELNSISSDLTLASIAFLEDGGILDAVQALTAAERAVAGVVATLLISVVVLGLLQGYGNRTVRKCRRSPVISVCIGLPSVFIFGLLSAAGYVMLGSGFGVFFGIPLVVAGATVLPAVTAMGFVAIGQSIAARLGRDSLPIGILIGSLVSGLVAVAIPIAIVITAIAAAFGMGASARVLFGSRGATDPDERTVPPANRV